MKIYGFSFILGLEDTDALIPHNYYSDLATHYNHFTYPVNNPSIQHRAGKHPRPSVYMLQDAASFPQMNSQP